MHFTKCALLMEDLPAASPHCEFALPPVSTYRLTVEKTGFPLIPKTESR